MFQLSKTRTLQEIVEHQSNILTTTASETITLTITIINSVITTVNDLIRVDLI